MENKKIRVTYEDKDYTLEYPRATVQQMERGGFRLDALDDMPMTMVMLLVRGAFLANHPNMKAKKVEAFYYDFIRSKDEFVSRLAEMYSETRDVLFEEKDEDDAKNPNWEANW